MNIIIAGDFCQKNRVDEIIKERRYGEIFDGIKDVIKRSDYSIVNLEFPIVLDSTKANPITKCGPNLQGTIESINAVKYAGFKCCTLANNHILDQGEQCCLDTKKQLENAGIDAIGVGNNIESASTILYKDFNGEKLAIINCCEHEFTIATEDTAGANPLNPIQQFYNIREARIKADYVIVIVHGGPEFYPLPTPRMQETYRFFIEAGADAVINHHQHCYSGYEIHLDKPIFYGIGNFCFDEPKMDDPKWNEGHLVSLCLNKNKITFELFMFKQCDKTASVDLLCEEEIKKRILSIERLNRQIGDRKLLSKRWTEWMDNNKDAYKYVLEPYNNGIDKRLFHHGIFPSFARKHKIELINYLFCESHLERIQEYVKNL